MLSRSLVLFLALPATVLVTLAVAGPTSPALDLPFGSPTPVSPTSPTPAAAA